MDYSISPITTEDREAIIDIFNYYIENSFAAFPESRLTYQAFDMFLQISKGFPTGVIKDSDGKTFGFGMLRAHNPMPVFAHAAEISCFIDNGHTGKGIGRGLLEYLESEGRKKGIKTILACISSLNPGSIKFHRNNGFAECGRFRDVGTKKGQVFDTVWMQKMI